MEHWRQIRHKCLALCEGHIPATTLLEEMIVIAVRYRRDAEYVIQQCKNLGLGRVGLPELHELCGNDCERLFKFLLGYEYGMIHKADVAKFVAGTHSQSPGWVECLVDAHNQALVSRTEQS